MCPKAEHEPRASPGLGAGTCGRKGEGPGEQWWDVDRGNVASVMTPMAPEPLARPGERQRDGTTMAKEVLEASMMGFPLRGGQKRRETARVLG